MRTNTDRGGPRLARIGVAAVVTAVIAMNGIGLSRADGPPQPMIGQNAPGFSLETLTEGTLALGDLEGRYVVLHFGTSW